VKKIAIASLIAVAAAAQAGGFVSYGVDQVTDRVSNQQSIAQYVRAGTTLGGKGGDLGKDGAWGGTGTNGGAGGGPGGRGGRAVVGSQHVTWTAYGTIKGGIRESTWVTIAGFYPDEPAITTDAEYYYWGQAAYGSSSNYLYAYTYSRTVWGDYPAVDHADNDYTGPLAFNTANGQILKVQLYLYVSKLFLLLMEFYRLREHFYTNQLQLKHPAHSHYTMCLMLVLLHQRP